MSGTKKGFSRKKQSDYQRSDRIKLFLLIFIFFSCVSLGFSYLYGFFDAPTDKKNEGLKPKGVQTQIIQNGESVIEEASAPYEIQESKMSYSEKEIDDSKNVAVSFMKAYYPSDSSEPDQYVRAAKPYMTDDFYEKEKESTQGQLDYRNPIRVISIEVLPVDHFVDNEVVWSLIINGEATSADGKVDSEKQEYFVVLQQVGASWKVNEVSYEGSVH